MPKVITIVGAGGFGREVAFAAETSAEPWTVHGFLDDRTESSQTPEGWQLLGDIASATPGMQCAVAVGNPRIRRKLVTRLQPTGVDFVTIDVECRRHSSVRIADGGMLVAGAKTTVNTEIGGHFIANLNCTIGHDVEIGDFVTIAPLVAISGNVRIGSGVEIGTGACVREGVSIGDGAMVGMGAVVVKDVEPNSIVVGNPARHVRSLEPW